MVKHRVGWGEGVDSLSDLQGTLVVSLEEVIRAVVLDCFSAILSHVEDWRQKTN
jgi:hypothetical protein